MDVTVRQFEERLSGSEVDTTVLIVPLMQSNASTQVGTTNGFYGIVQFRFSYNVRYDRLPGNHALL